MIDRPPRSEEAQELLTEFMRTVKESDLSEKDKESLRGALASLHEQSFSSALMSFVDNISEPKEISGYLLYNPGYVHRQSFPGHVN